MFRRKVNQARIENVVAHARDHIGERSRVNKVNPYGAQVGYDGQAWAGSYLEMVMRWAGERGLPSLVSTASALSVFHREGRISVSPQVGDIVFYAFSTDHQFAQPHIGLVTDVSQWKLNGAFRAVEGQTASGLPRGPQENDGIYERTRFSTDVLAFARPAYGDTEITEEPESGVPAVRPAQFQPNKVSKACVYLQTALHETVGARGMTRGKFDAATRSAVAAYQRRIGYVGDAASGLPDGTTLRRLAADTSYRYFRVRPEAV